jgi:hypothetical protein
VNIEIVKRSDQAHRFVVLPKRWIVERHCGGFVAGGMYDCRRGNDRSECTG